MCYYKRHMCYDPSIVNFRVTIIDLKINGAIIVDLLTRNELLPYFLGIREYRLTKSRVS